MGLARWLSILVVTWLAAMAMGQESADLSSTRSVMRTFMMSTADERWDVALETLDLSQIPAAERRKVGIEAAKVILSALETSLFEVTDIPDTTEGARVVVARLKPNPTEPAIEIALGRNSAGDWRITKETVESVPALRNVLAATEAGQPDNTTTEAPGSATVSKSVSEMMGQLGGVKPPTSSDSGPAVGSQSTDLSSPQAAMSTYLEAMNAGDVDGAILTLDLSRINPVLRPEEGRRYANLLLAILNRTEYIIVSDLPLSPPGGSYTYWTYRNRATGAVVGEIILAKSASGSWQFSSSTISQLPDIWEYIKDRPVIPGLKDVDEIDFEPSVWLKSRMPEAWHRPLLGLARWQWVTLGSLLAIAAVFALFVRAIVAKVLSRRSKNHVDSGGRQTAINIGRAASWVFACGIVRGGLQFLGFPAWLNTSVAFLSTLGLYFSFGWLLFGVLDRLIRFAAMRAASVSDKGQRLVAPVVAKLGRAIIVIGVVIAMMSTFGVNVTAIIAGLGIGGLVVALAAKDSVENLFGSFTILMEMPFGIGDWVKIGDVEGVVEEISLRSTRIRTFSDSIIVLPNKNLITAALENMGARRRRQFKTNISLGSHTSADRIRQFCDRVRDELIENPGIDNDTAYCSLYSYADNLLTVLLSCYISAPSYAEELRIRQDVLARILEIAHELEIEIATPSRAIQIETPKSLMEKNEPKPQT